MTDAEKVLSESQFLKSFNDPVLNELLRQIIEAYVNKDTETENKLIKLMTFYNKIHYPELIKSIPL